METERLTIAPGEARDLYRAYKKHKHYSEPIDREISRAYQLLSQGRLVIKALASITAAGLDDAGHPKLAIACATAKQCVCSISTNGSATMDSRTVLSYRSRDDTKWIAERAFFQFPRGSFKPRQQVWSIRAQVPLVPIMHRPKRGLPNYHILWEAEMEQGRAARSVPAAPHRQGRPMGGAGYVGPHRNRARRAGDEALMTRAHQAAASAGCRWPPVRERGAGDDDSRCRPPSNPPAVRRTGGDSECDALASPDCSNACRSRRSGNGSRRRATPRMRAAATRGCGDRRDRASGGGSC